MTETMSPQPTRGNETGTGRGQPGEYAQLMRDLRRAGARRKKAEADLAAATADLANQVVRARMAGVTKAQVTATAQVAKRSVEQWEKAAKPAAPTTD